MKRLTIYLYVLPLLLQGQYIKIRSCNIKEFPKIKLLLTIEDDSGRIYPIHFDSISIYEDNSRIQNFRFIPIDSLKIPIFAVIVLDQSGSMSGFPLQKAKKSVEVFLSAMKSQDQTALITFENKVHLISNFTNNKKILLRKISSIEARGNTAFNDAIYKSLLLLNEIKSRNAVKVIVALTDGVDNRSVHTLDKIIKFARRSGVNVYSVGVGYKINRKELRKLAHLTGGKYYFAPDPEDLIEIYRNISKLVHSSVLITYITMSPLDSKWHSIIIEIFSNGRKIIGGKKCLYARYSKIPDYLLKEIDEANSAGPKNLSGNTSFFKGSNVDIKLIIIVLIFVVIILITLLLIIIYKEI